MSNVSRKINQRLLWPVTTMVREISSIWTISCHYNSLLHNNSLSLTTLDHNWGSTRKEHKEDNLNIELILEWLLSEPESRPISSNKSHTHGISHRDQIILHTPNQTFVLLDLKRSERSKISTYSCQFYRDLLFHYTRAKTWAKTTHHRLFVFDHPPKHYEHEKICMNLTLFWVKTLIALLSWLVLANWTKSSSSLLPINLLTHTFTKLWDKFNSV